MRRTQNEITDPKIIEDILSGSDVCRIAMIENNRPYIVPLNYGYKNNTLYFHSSELGKKIELLKADNKVCFEIELFSQVTKKENPCDWSTKYRSVIGYGTIEFITGSREKRNGLDIIMAHYGKKDKNTYPDSIIEKVMILKLKIEEITGKQSGNWD